MFIYICINSAHSLGVFELHSDMIFLRAQQVITGSHDCTIRLWDLAMGRTRVTLTNHKRSVRALSLHPKL